ncbi:MAG TPA: hypothetical protein VKH20_02915, partial [Solirubrobacterales bacterium]|nr:hypothetical protein [Solirubrobacterales bacterium]
MGVAELGVLIGFAWLGAMSVRRRLVPEAAGIRGALASAVLGIAGLIWAAELLGSVGSFKPLPYLAVVIVVGTGLRLRLGGRWGGPSDAAASSFSPHSRPRTAADSPGEKPSKTEGPPHLPSLAALVALAIAAVAIVHFATGVRLRLSTGMTGFDSTWYHGPFAAGFFQ